MNNELLDNIKEGVRLLNTVTDRPYVVVYDNASDLWALAYQRKYVKNQYIDIVPVVMAKDLNIMAQFIQMVINVFIIIKDRYFDNAVIHLTDYDYLITGENDTEVHDKNKCS